MATSVLFVCLGNICRSPTAHGVFQELVRAANLQDQVEIDSAGTGNWHAGESPDPRALAAASARGYDLSGIRARSVGAADFSRFDYVLAMDEQNLARLQDMAPPDYHGHLGLFLDYHSHPLLTEVPDPYLGGKAGFDQVLDLVEEASRGLLKAINA
jgi:protein-tyrosine phosphatase